MNLRLVSQYVALETDDALHLTRTLFLLQAAALRKKNRSINGITKLAKLDFLVRYPNCLARALEATNRPNDAARIAPHERSTIESRMIRFRYGPWDPRYRRWIGLLVSRGLATTYLEGRTVHVEATTLGLDTASTLAEQEELQSVADRCHLVVRVWGRTSPTRLMQFVYEVFPELSGMRWGEEIQL